MNNTAEKLNIADQVVLPHSLTIKAIKAALAFAAKRDVRFYLNGVLFEFKENLLNIVATDGHRILHVPIELPEVPANLVDSQWILERETLRQLVYVIKAKSSASDLVFRIPLPGSCFASFITASGFAMSVGVINGTYPDYPRTLIRKGKVAVKPRHKIQAIYLADIAKLQPLLNRGNIEMHVRGENEVVHFFGLITGTELDLQLALMPVRLEEGP